MRTTVQIAALAIGLSLVSAARAETLVKPLVELGTEARYDSDPYLDGENEFFSKVSPKVGATVENENLKLRGWYAADVMYKAIQQVPEVDHRGQLKLSDQLSRRLELHADLQLWKVQDPTSLPRTGLAAVPVPILYGTAALGLNYRLSQRATLQLDDRQEIAKIYAKNLPFSMTQTPSLGLRYALTERDTLTTAYRYQAFLALPQVVGQTHAVLLGIDHKLSHTWHVFAKAGPLMFLDGRTAAQLQNLGITAQSAVVPVGEGGLGWNGKYSEVDLVLGHDLVGSAGYAAAVWTDYAQLAWAVHPWAKVTFYVGGGGFRNGTAPAQTTNIYGYTVEGGVGYALTETLQLRGSAERLQQRADEKDQLVALDRNIFGVQLTWTPKLGSWAP